MTVHCAAKINVFLDITKKYKNGFHKIESIFLETDLVDELNYELLSTPTCVVEDLAEKINPQQNLLCDAYQTFFNFCRKKPIGIKFILKKIIPLGGGLGGGSSNAAGVLKILNQVCQTRFSSKTLKKISAQIGSDVPYFIEGKTQKVMGKGEITSKINSTKMKFYVLMVFPEIKISTPLAYSWLDNDQKINENYINQKKKKLIITALKNGNYQLFINSLYNKFEESVFMRHKELSIIKNEILKSGADGALMSGSGSTILGFFLFNEKMNKSVEILRKKGYKTHVARVTI